VTTGIFSEPAQQEIVDDEYPIVLVHGARLAQEVRMMAYETHAGRIADLLEALIASGGGATITHRRPEEILFV
jgi:hypothetical protein